MKLRHIIILQNKIDLVKENQAKEQYDQIIKFVQGTVAEKAPVIPISAQLKYNIEAICEYLVKKVPIPLRDFTCKPKLIIIRSFDVNKPGCEVDDLKGGVAGGSILKGVLVVSAYWILTVFWWLFSYFLLVIIRLVKRLRWDPELLLEMRLVNSVVDQLNRKFWVCMLNKMISSLLHQEA